MSFPRVSALLWPTALLALAACRPDTLGNAEIGFEADPGPVEFGRVLEHSQVSRVVQLRSLGRVDVTVSVSTQAPFSAVSSMLVPGASSAPLEVVFTAGDAQVEVPLVLSANGKSVEVMLRGEGLRRTCTAINPCHTARFDLESDRCVQTPLADGEDCQPESRCLQDGVCQGGECLGQPRTCDDDDRCTSDYCSEEQGCLNPRITCPPVLGTCQVPVCRSDIGCGSGPADDGTGCGSIDCHTAHLCIGGSCQTLQTPDGFLCARATPCQAEGRCRTGECQRPDAGLLAPRFWVGLGALRDAGEISLRATGGNLFWDMCLEGDAGCGLYSYTGTGFLRFAAPHADGRERQVAAVGAGTVMVLGADGIETYSSTDGDAGWLFLPGGSAVLSDQSLAMFSDGRVEVGVGWRPSLDDGGSDGGEDGGDDAGATAWPQAGHSLMRWAADGGPLRSLDFPSEGPPELALCSDGALFSLDRAQELRRLETLSDGGETVGSVFSADGGAGLLCTGDRLLAADTLVDLDGGAVLGTLDLVHDGGVLLAVPGGLLGGARELFMVAAECPPLTSCNASEASLFVRTFNARDGGTEWTLPLIPSGLSGRLIEAALVEGGAVIALTQLSADAGSLSHVQMLGSGQRYFACELPAPDRFRGAVFESGYLYVLIDRTGVLTLEGYDLGQLPLEMSGWPQKSGVSGTRRAR